MSNLGDPNVWNEWWPDLYGHLDEPRSYPGNPDTYKIAGGFFAGEKLVEEWGCATTWGKQFIPAPYRGVDGGPSKFVDVVADLREYSSDVPNAIIRHVLEHNWDWRKILDNFMGSFTEKAAIILFIPMGRHDINRSFENRVDEPKTPPGLQLDEVSFWDLVSRPGVSVVRDEVLTNDTPPFGYERIILLERRDNEDKFMTFPHPRCVYCNQVGFEQMRVNLEMLRQRYEMAVNVCLPCMKKAQAGLYSLNLVPEVGWTLE